jgi:branched-subunit amino acid transport protein
MPEQKILLIILGMAVVTYLPRMLPLVILSKVKLPAVFIKWLKYIPQAVLSALLLPGILTSGGRLDLSLDNHALIAAIPCFIVAILWKNLFVTVVAGVVSMLLLNCFL